MEKPWLSEPDRVEWWAFGYPCLIRRSPTWGSLCGYVGVFLGHPGWGQDRELDVAVHGGVTFADLGDGEEWPSAYWWIGFDCGHYMDYQPKLNEYVESLRQNDSLSALFSGFGQVYRDLPYVRAQTEALAHQMAEMHEAHLITVGRPKVGGRWVAIVVGDNGSGATAVYFRRARDARCYLQRQLAGGQSIEGRMQRVGT